MHAIMKQINISIISHGYWLWHEKPKFTYLTKFPDKIKMPYMVLAEKQVVSTLFYMTTALFSKSNYTLVPLYKFPVPVKFREH